MAQWGVPKGVGVLPRCRAEVAAKEAAQTAAEVEEALAEHAARVAAEEEARVTAAATATQRALLYHARGPPQSRRASLSQREAEIRAALGIREFVNSCARSSAQWRPRDESERQF